MKDLADRISELKCEIALRESRFADYRKSLHNSWLRRGFGLEHAMYRGIAARFELEMAEKRQALSELMNEEQD